MELYRCISYDLKELHDLEKLPYQTLDEINQMFGINGDMFGFPPLDKSGFERFQRMGIKTIYCIDHKKHIVLIDLSHNEHIVLIDLSHNEHIKLRREIKLNKLFS